MMQPQAVSRCEDKPTQAQPSSSQTGDPGHQPMMSGLHALQIQAFRNYPSAELGLQSKAVVLTGPNGAGKTKLLEAVSMLAPGRGLRRAQRGEIGHFSEQLTQNRTDRTKEVQGASWSVFAELSGPEGVVAVGTGQAPEQPDAPRRVVRVNGVASAQTDLARLVTLSWLTPQMDGLFIGAPSARRRFIDRLAIAFDPAHSGRLSRYQKAWRERTRLLSDGHTDENWCASLEKILAETGIAISATRSALIDDINRESGLLASSFPVVKAHLTGQAADWLEAGLPAIDIEDRILLAARQNRQAGLSHMPGPHETDLTLVYKGQSAHLASTGEQKALMIAMVLAHAVLQDKRLGRPPILLLDDVAAHLDPARRAELFSLCSELSGQVWYSGVDAQAFLALREEAQFIAVSDGQLNL
ncbi:MAG: DNA replication/repair protein RecF [Pseudomonadota bacterium]|nr:DNA replication/repair protein RecF [Pseudomonadota bacterium]